MRRALLLIVALAACRHFHRDGAKDAPAKPTDAPRPHGPGLRPGRYDIVELHVDVKPKHWIRAEPDLVLGLLVDGAHVADCRDAHTAQGVCHFGSAIEITDRSEITIELTDRDGGATLADPSTWGTDLIMPMAPRGDVTGATIVLAPARSWWDVNGARLLGLAIGIAGALGTIAIFRRQLMPPAPVAPPPPTCSHCGKRLALGATTCAHCGASP